MFLPLGDDVDQRRLPLVGTLLILVNAVVYAYEIRLFNEAIVEQDPEIILGFWRDWGAVPSRVLGGDGLWTLLTCQFLHGDIWHLAGNMIVLWAFCRTLEDALGTWTFLGFYLIWGVSASLCDALSRPDSAIPAVGASGAIAGVMGAYFVGFGLRTKVKTLVLLLFIPWRVDIPAVVYFGFWFLTQLAGSESAGETSIAWFAHIGGFLVGAGTMALVRDNLTGKLVTNEDGKLEVMTDEERAADEAEKRRRDELAGRDLIAQHAVAEPSVRADKRECPYCGTALAREHKIAAGMLQCPNDACRRLLMMQ